MKLLVVFGINISPKFLFKSTITLLTVAIEFLVSKEV